MKGKGMEGKKIRRCAVYTRKSNEEGLEQEYNTLDAQFDAATAYIKSQAANGWVQLPKHYDDGGFSGGNINRPALRELMKDVEAGEIDIIVVYKIDRLSRSLCDFVELSKIFEKHGVSFVSVTQQIDTSNAAGRMMLNILISFGQFEREMCSDRIRDKVLATRKKGMWSGGTVPYGYRAVEKKLVPDDLESQVVRFIFSRYAEVASAKTVAREVDAQFGPRREVKDWNVSHIYRILRNRIYKGDLPHKRSGQVFKGVHEPLVDDALWSDCQRILSEAAVEQPSARRETAAPLKGLLRCGHCNGPMTPTFSSKKKGVRYSYYICNVDSKRPASKCPVRRIGAEQIERMVFDRLGEVLKTTEFVKLVARQCEWSEADARKALSDMSGFMAMMNPAERDRLVHCLVHEIVVRNDGIDIELKTAGMENLTKEIVYGETHETA